MYSEKKCVKTLIEGATSMEVEALIELKDLYYSYAVSRYNIIIGESYGNQHFDDFIGKVEDSILKSIKEFRGSTREAFCLYINTCITNIAYNYYRDHIKYKYKFISLDEISYDIDVFNYCLTNNNFEDLVVSKIAKYEILFEHILPELPDAERAAVLRKMNDVETVGEYAKRISCAENTVRAHESKALKKMREKAANKRLKELYHL